MKKINKIQNDLSIPLQSNNAEWNLYLYKKIYNKKVLNSYEIHKINSIYLNNLYSDIHIYMNKKYINKLEINNYSSEMPKNQIGFIDLTDNNNILKNSLELLNDGINNYMLFNRNSLDFHGYILECIINGKTYMKILSTSNPIKIYQHKYSLLFNNKFTELQNPILTLNKSCDCMLLNEYALFFTGKAENIFDLQKHYKALAISCLASIKNQNILENFDSFSNYASTWPKATRFENFNSARIAEFAKLTKIEKEFKLNQFSISLNSNGAIITNSPEDYDHVLNFICGKLLYDFNNDGYEVCYPKKINL